EREGPEPDHEHALAAIEVAEPPAGDEADRINEAIRRDDELRLPEACVQIGADARERDVDDEGVHDRHEGAGQRHGEAKPAGRGLRGNRFERRQRRRRDVLGHGCSPEIESPNRLGVGRTYALYVIGEWSKLSYYYE